MQAPFFFFPTYYFSNLAADFFFLSFFVFFNFWLKKLAAIKTKDSLREAKKYSNFRVQTKSHFAFCFGLKKIHGLYIYQDYYYRDNLPFCSDFSVC